VFERMSCCWYSHPWNPFPYSSPLYLTECSVAPVKAAGAAGVDDSAVVAASAAVGLGDVAKQAVVAVVAAAGLQAVAAVAVPIFSSCCHH